MNIYSKIFDLSLAPPLRLIRDDDGSDLIEYALLTALIGVVSIATWDLIAGKLGTSYAAHDTDTQKLWESPNPQ